MKEYGELLETPDARAFSARVRDISELLGAIAPRAPRGPVPLRVVYHDACHLAHAQRVRDQPRELLRGIPGLELLEVRVSATCVAARPGSTTSSSHGSRRARRPQGPEPAGLRR